MKKHKKVVLVIGLVIILLAAGVGAFVMKRSSDDKKATDATQTEAKPGKTDFNDPDGQKILDLFKKEGSTTTGCIGDNSQDKPFVQSEQDAVSGIVFDSAKTRANAKFCNVNYFLGKKKDGSWATLYISQASLSSALVDACKLNDLVKKLDTANGGSLIDDKYFGGKGSETYTKNTTLQVKICTDFVTANG